MKKTLILSPLTLLLVLATTIAGAADLTGKFGITAGSASRSPLTARYLLVAV